MTPQTNKADWRERKSGKEQTPARASIRPAGIGSSPLVDLRRDHADLARPATISVFGLSISTSTSRPPINSHPLTYDLDEYGNVFENIVLHLTFGYKEKLETHK